MTISSSALMILQEFAPFGVVLLAGMSPEITLFELLLFEMQMHKQVLCELHLEAVRSTQ